jgi:hypothetical protein
MTKRPKPTVHGRDHEHGGADVTLIHYEDVGADGGGGGLPPQGSYILTKTGAGSHGLSTYTWSLFMGDALLDLTDPNAPTVLDDGVYAVTVVATVPAALGTGEFGWFKLVMYNDPDFDIFAGGETVGYHNTVTTPSETAVSMSCTWAMLAGSQMYVSVWNGGSSSHDYLAAGFVQKVA